METKRSVYLDHAATTPIDIGVLEKILPYFGNEYGNPSSMYESGRKSRRVIENARQGIAELIGANSNEIIFTGSGTESDNLAVLGVTRANKEYGNHILISSIEHKAVLESAKRLEKEGFDVEYIPVDKYGIVDVDEIMNMITDKTILISVMYANNEIGSIQPVQELGRRIRELKSRKSKVESKENSRSEFPASPNEERRTTNFPLLHTDACQAVGQLPVDVRMLGVDLMTCNASKIYGPKGVGVLYKKDTITIEPIIVGGGQEGGLRSGTESVPLIFGMYESLTMIEKNREVESVRLTSLRDYTLRKLQENIPDIVINGHPTNRLPNNIHISIPSIEGESIVLMLDERGIQVSTGSACSSHDLEVSHVLKAIYLRPSRELASSDQNLMHGSIRMTLGKDTTKSDIDYCLQELSAIVVRLKSMSPLTMNL